MGVKRRRGMEAIFRGNVRFFLGVYKDGFLLFEVQVVMHYFD